MLKHVYTSVLHLYSHSLTFKGHSITADGSDGIIDVIFSGQGGVDVHHLKVHGHAAEPGTTKHNNDDDDNLRSTWISPEHI